MSNTHDRFLALAAEIALKGIKSRAGGPFGAVIVRGQRIIAKAHNTVLRSQDPTCHAEINAIRHAAIVLKTPFFKGTTIYSTTEPCPMCFSAIHWAQIPKLYYSTSIRDVKRLGFNELSVSAMELKRQGHSPVAVKRLANGPCKDLLRTWSQDPKNSVY